MSDSNFKINKGITLTPQSSVPTNPVNGDVYYDSVINSFIHYNNGKWINLASKVDVASAASLTSTQFTATVVQSSLVKVTGSTVANLHGLTASSDGKEIILYNTNSATITVKNQSVTEATAINRIVTLGSVDVILVTGQTMVLVYDGTQARWVATSPAGVTSATDHGTLTGLADDDHTQYALLAGRSAGQTLNGGNLASANLNLRSTTDGTKGKINLGLASAYDDLNERLGIGTGSPGTPVDVVGNIRTTTQLESTIVTGTAPLVVASTTVVTNLNADLLDGNHGSFYAQKDLPPTVQRFTSTGAFVYTIPANVTYLVIELVGAGGGGGGGQNAVVPDGGTGGGGSAQDSSITGGGILFTAGGGAGGNTGTSAPGTGGAASNTGGIIINSVSGGDGGNVGISLNNGGGAGIGSVIGGIGGSSYFGGAGNPGSASGGSGRTNTGGGGGGGATAVSGGTEGGRGGPGGGAGAYFVGIITSPGSMTGIVGAGGAGGAAGTASGASTSGAGGAGGSGQVIVWEFYQ